MEISKSYSEYMAGLARYGFLCNNDVADNKFETPDSNKRYLELVRNDAQGAVEKYRFQ